MTTDITVREDSMSPAAVKARMDYARALASSSLLPDAYRKQPANVLIAIEYGQALGIRPIAALTGINVIKGRPTMSADLMASVVRQAGHKLRVEQRGMSVRATLIRADDPEFQFHAIWDADRAQAAGLWGQAGPWSQYPEQMLRSRAITEVCRQGASDCLYGAIYAPEELDGVESPPQPHPAPAETRDQITDLHHDLARRFTTRFGGDPDQLIQEWAAEGRGRTPSSLHAWLEARIPQPDQEAGADTAGTQTEIIDAELIPEEDPE